jgi:hypothetical protein
MRFHDNLHIVSNGTLTAAAASLTDVNEAAVKED